MLTSPTNPEKPIAGAVALVTGASRGIGFAIAEKLGSLGARVALCARDASKLANAERRLRSAHIESLSIVADVRRQSDIDSLLEKTRAALGPIDILVNNAGVGAFGPFHQQQETDWDAVIDTNLKAVFLLSRAVAPEMIRRRTGHIINIASLAGKNAFAGGGIYCASKWGLLGLTGCMAEDLRGFGIRVSAVCPGTVATDFSPHTGKDSSKMLQPEDVAHAVAALVTQAPQSFMSEILLRPTQKP
jgi:NAD(P)-dependent dehydrogenase (short-subunit alcohol dehydrogenase family)